MGPAQSLAAVPDAAEPVVAAEVAEQAVRQVRQIADPGVANRLLRRAGADDHGRDGGWAERKLDRDFGEVELIQHAVTLTIPPDRFDPLNGSP